MNCGIPCSPRCNASIRARLSPSRRNRGSTAPALAGRSAMNGPPIALRSSSVASMRWGLRPNLRIAASAAAERRSANRVNRSANASCRASTWASAAASGTIMLTLSTVFADSLLLSETVSLALASARWRGKICQPGDCPCPQFRQRASARSLGQDRIIVRIILNRLSALRACGCCAGMRIISPPCN